MNAKILIITSRDEDLKLVEHYLQSFPAGVDTAGDGIQALHKILSNRYSVIIAFPPINILSIEKLIEIVRTNPNTSSLPFLVIYQNKKEMNSDIKADVIMAKPLIPDKFIATLNEMLPQSRIKKLLDKTRVISFNLDEISVIDILQLLYQNKKTGILDLEIEDKKGKIYLSSGEIVTARIGNLKGEKALFRILESDIGSAVFLNQPVDFPREISYPTPHLILRGIQEKDETRRFLQELGTKELKLAVDYQEKLKETTSMVREIVSMLEFTSYLNVILDSIDLPDSEILKIIKDLTEKGIVLPQKDQPLAIEDQREIITPEQERKLIEKFSNKLAFPTSFFRGAVILIPEYMEQLKPLIRFLYLEKLKNEFTSPFAFAGYYPLSKRAQLNFYVTTDMDTIFPFLNSFKKLISEIIFIYDEFSQDALFLTQEKSKLPEIAEIKVSSLFLEEGADEENYYLPSPTRENFNKFIGQIIKRELEAK